MINAPCTNRDAKLAYKGPQAADLPGRLQAALPIVYHIFTEGYGTS